MEFYREETLEELKTFLHNNSKNSNLIDDLKKRFPHENFKAIIVYIFQNSQDIDVLNKILRYVNLSKLQEFLPYLITFISSENWNENFLSLKVIAIKTIANYKDKSAVPALLYCLNDKNSNYKIRLACADALGKIGDKNAFETLTNIVYDEKEKSTYVKESAVNALGMLGDNRAIDVFDSIMSTKQMFLDKFIYLKERIVEAIGNLEIENNSKAIEILKKSITDPSDSLRISSIEAIMNSNIKESYDLIYDRLQNDVSLEVKENALIALYNISDKAILEEVLNNDYCEELKKLARKILEEYEENNE